jgi:hypothetical protein
MLQDAASEELFFSYFARLLTFSTSFSVYEYGKEYAGSGLRKLFFGYFCFQGGFTPSFGVV